MLNISASGSLTSIVWSLSSHSISSKLKPAFDSGLTSVSVSEETPYGTAAVDWEIVEDQILVHVTVPANTEAEICLPGRERETVGSGTYSFLCQRPGKQW